MTIECRFCGEELNSLIEGLIHVCPNYKDKHIWKNNNIRYSKNSETRLLSTLSK